MAWYGGGGWDVQRGWGDSCGHALIYRDTALLERSRGGDSGGGGRYGNGPSGGLWAPALRGTVQEPGSWARVVRERSKRGDWWAPALRERSKRRNPGRGRYRNGPSRATGGCQHCGNGPSAGILGAGGTGTVQTGGRWAPALRERSKRRGPERCGGLAAHLRRDGRDRRGSKAIAATGTAASISHGTAAGNPMSRRVPMPALPRRTIRPETEESAPV